MQPQTMMMPKFDSAGGHGTRIVAGRVHPDQDVLDAIAQICVKHGIRYGQITTCIGSLRSLRLNYVSRPIRDEELGYTSQLSLDGAFSVLAGQGLVSPNDVDEERRNTHLHVAVSGQHDVVYGGHVEPGTRTLTTLDVFIQELAGIEIVRSRDPQTGAVVTSINEVTEEQ